MWYRARAVLLYYPALPCPDPDCPSTTLSYPGYPAQVVYSALVYPGYPAQVVYPALVYLPTLGYPAQSGVSCPGKPLGSLRKPRNDQERHLWEA